MALHTEERHYQIGDSELYQAARKFLREYGNYQEAFADLDSDTFHENFQAEFDDDIVDGELIPSDDQLRDEQAKESEEAYAVRDLCVDEVRFARYFVKKVFPGDTIVHDQFGYDTLESDRRNISDMISFMSDFNRKVEEYHIPLVEGKYPDTKLPYLKELHALLIKESGDQSDAKTRRKKIAKKRVRKNNRIWQKMALLADAAKYALPEDEVAQEIFTLPRPESSTESSV